MSSIYLPYPWTTQKSAVRHAANKATASKTSYFVFFLGCGAGIHTATKLSLADFPLLGRVECFARIMSPLEVAACYAATAVALTAASTATNSSTCAELNSPSGPRGVRSVNGDS